MARVQRGTIILKSNRFYCRYYAKGTGNASGKVQEYLCDVDADHWYRRRKGRLEVSHAVELKRAELMLKVNGSKNGDHSALSRNVTVEEFFESAYKPSWEARGLRGSTRYGYEKIWEIYVKPELGHLRLRAITTPMVTAFLTRLASKLGRNSLSHARALLSAMYAFAVSAGAVSTSPVAGAKILAQVRKPKEQKFYSIDQARALLKALEPRPEAKLIFCLSYFMGLRPSEVFGLRFEDFKDGRLHLKRSLVRRQLGELKTEGSASSLLVIQPVTEALEAWRASRGNPDQGWVFKSQAGDRPVTSESFCKHVLKPLVDKAGLEWLGLYACRRSVGTVLRDLSKSLVASQQVLRHSFMSTTDKHYALKSTTEADRGLRLLEEAWKAES
jgi:integrase